MHKFIKVFFVITILAVGILSVAGNTYQFTENAFLEHLKVLASDSLEGRETGEPGEWKAAAYITGVFKSLGLQPKGDSGSYLQAFEFIKKIDFGENNRLAVNGQTLKLDNDFKPMLQSANSEFDFDEVVPVNYGITINDTTYDDYTGLDVAGKAVLIKRFSPESEDSLKPDSNVMDFDRYNSITDKIENAIEHDVAGIFIYTPEGHDDTLLFLGSTRVHPKDIPIIYLRRDAITRLGIDTENPASFRAAGATELIHVPDTGYNVVGYLPAQNDTVIVIGAHYDHLGWGGPASRYLGQEKKIHYGADDNASGTSGVLELARYYTSRKDLNRHSFLFIAFSGEEKGILGSSYFARHMTVDTSKIMMMFNLDMIGRLREEEKGLGVLGVGTSEEFKGYFDTLDNKDIKISFRESGTGPSDHTSFYNSGIPVLFFFTGVHEDYHKPDDVIEKINLEGMVKVISTITDITDHFDRDFNSLTFLKTKSDSTYGGPQNFSVTLGIMPDFISDVKGLRVDGVSGDRPAERAGILKGDVIIRMGDYEIDDIYTYMNGLKKFRKGDTTTVRVERGRDTLDLKVEFR
ncbi:MAG: M28 family peptidase [Candidatus Zixiibacteriota bacterium]